MTGHRLKGRKWRAGELAKVLEWTPRRTLRWMKSAGVAFKEGKHWYTTLRLLQDKAPDTFAELELSIDYEGEG